MLHSTDSPNRLSENAYRAVEDSLVNLGFDYRGILRDQKISLNKDVCLTLDALAFAHPRRRRTIDTCFTLYNATNGKSEKELVRLLASSGAPFHILHRDDQFSLWTGATDDARQIDPMLKESDIAYDRLNQVLDSYSTDLTPQRILDFKQRHIPFFHFPELDSIQLSLFAQNVTGALLKTYFSYAVDTLREHMLDDETVSRLAIQLLAIVVLADTGGLGDDIRLDRDNYSIAELISEANTHSFGRYFDETLFNQHQRAVENGYDWLRKLYYANFEPNLIPKLQLSAYTDSQRKQYGLYDTPLYLTRRIWDAIPVEFLPPEERHVADMTCGWGSFLIAGHQRLSYLTDSLPLQEFLHGNDIYGPTHLWASLGLLLSTFEDSWHIDHEDGLNWPWLENNQPNIIVGNPPFEGNRKRPVRGEKKRHERANLFLKKAIDRLASGGYLAMVMPRSFVAAQPSPELREYLLTTCDVLELWEIPDKAFPEATVRTTVVFAQKKESFGSLSVRTRTIQRDSLKQFQEGGVFTASSYVPNQQSWDKFSNRSRKTRRAKNNFVMEYKLILPESTWREIRSKCKDLEEVAVIFQGAILGKYSRPVPSPKIVKWLGRAKEILKSDFHIAYPSPVETKRYPNDFNRPRKRNEVYFTQPKVLLVSIHDPSWGKRVKVAIEHKGYYVADNFWVLVPRTQYQEQHITNQVIGAILSWKVSNAWIVEHMRHTKLPGYAIKTVPFPTLAQPDCEALTAAINNIEQQYDVQHNYQVIDQVLRDAYQLDESIYERLSTVYDWDDKPRETLDPHKAVDAAWGISGIVENVDVENGVITVWTDEFDELQTIPIHPAMPGWMLRKRAAFRVKIPYQQAEMGFLGSDFSGWGRFEPQPYTYLSEDELLDEIFDVFKAS